MNKRLVGAFLLASAPVFSFAEGFAGEAGITFIGDGSDSQSVAAYNYIGYELGLNGSIAITPELLLATGISSGDVDGSGRFSVDSMVGVGAKVDYSVNDLVQLYVRANYVTMDYENSLVAATPTEFQDNALALGAGVEVGLFNFGYTTYSNEDAGGEDFVAINFGFSYSF